MNYELLWKTLEELMIELADRGVTIPQELRDNLKSAKTFISIYNTDPSALDVVTEAALYLDKIEPNLLYLAESEVGKKYASAWVKKISDARLEKAETTAPSKFVAEIPRGEHWIRIKIADIISDDNLKELLKNLNLSSKSQDDGYLLIYGKEENVKSFIREVDRKIGKGKFK